MLSPPTMILSEVFPLRLLLPLPPLVLLPHALRMSTRMIPATIHSCLFLAFITLFSSPVLPGHLGDQMVPLTIPLTGRSCGDGADRRRFASAPFVIASRWWP